MTLSRLASKFCIAAAFVLAATTAGPAVAQSAVVGQILGMALKAAQQQEAARQGAAAQQPQGGLSKAERVAVQRRLNELGYNAGSPDGAFGAGTRRAILGWQAAQGEPVTGELTSGQVARLLGTPAPQAVVMDDDDSDVPDGPADAVNLLYDTDLPYNDYRSGMNDRSLKGIDLPGCEQVCESEAQCRAFTYNGKARICFLKAAVGKPSHFAGAISGVKGSPEVVLAQADANAGPAAGDGAVRALNRAEIADLQKALAARGYDVGTPDGKPGSKTRKAIAAFVAENPGRATTNIDTALLAAVTGDAAPPVTAANSGFGALNALATGTPAATEAAPAGDEVAPTPPPDAEFPSIETQYLGEDPDLFRMIVAARPALLDDKELLTNLFESEGRKFTSSYRVDEELAAFKQEYLARTVPRVVYLDLVDDVALERGQYQRDRQLFPFGLGLSRGEIDRYVKFSVRTSDKAYDVEFAVPTMPDVLGLPMTLEQAEAFERDRFDRGDRTYSISIHRKVAMSAISFNETHGAFEGKLTLYGVEARPYGNKETEVLQSWAPVAPAAPAPAIQQLATLDQLSALLPGLALVDGQLNIRQSPDWPHVAASVFMSIHPAVFDDPQLSLPMARGLLSETEQHDLWHGEPPYAWKRLDLRDVDMGRMNIIVGADYGATLLSRALKPAFGLIDVMPAKFGAFDAGKGQIALQVQPQRPMLYDDAYQAKLSWSLGNVVLPRQLPVDQTMAQQLIGQLGGDPAGQTVYVAVFADVNNAEVDKDRGGALYAVKLTSKAKRVALFKDAALTQLIFDYTADPRSTLAAEQAVQDEVLALNSMPSQSIDVLHRVAADLSGDAAYLDDVVNFTLKDRKLNEFDRATAGQQMLDGLHQLQVPQPLWIGGTLRLGEYNTRNGSFAVDTSTIRMSYEGSHLGLVDSQFPFAFTTVPTEIAVPLAEAKAFVERAGDDREVDVRYRVTPVLATVERTRYGEIVPTITYHLDRIVLLAPDKASPLGVEKLADVDYGAYTGVETSPAGADATPIALGDRPLFTQELAAIMAYGDGSTPLSDTDYRRMLASRWLIDQQVGFASAVPAPFFPKDAQLPAAASLNLYRKDFDSWLGRAAQTQPTHLRLTIDFRDDHMAPRLPAQCSDMEWGLRYVFQNQELARALFGAAGDSMQDDQMHLIGRGSDTKPAVVENFLLGFPYASAAGCEIPQSNGVRDALDVDSTPPPQSAFVVIDRMPVPNFLSRTAYTDAEVDVTVTGVERLPRPNGGLPTLIVHAKFEKAELKVSEIANGQRTVTKSTPVTLDSLAPDKLSLDILGITIGMSEADADAKVRAHLPDPIVLKSVADPSPSMPPFGDVTMYFSPDLKERVALIYEAGTKDRTVLGVHRVISAPDWSLPRADVNAGAIGKYGPPAFEEDTEDRTLMAWGPGAKDRECRSVSDGADAPDNFTDASGKQGRLPDFVDWSTVRDSMVAFLPQPQWDADLRGCEGVVTLEHRDRYLSTFMIDPALYYSSWQASMAGAKQAIEEKAKSGGGSTTLAF